MQQQLDYGQRGQSSSVDAGRAEQPAKVSSKRESWRTSVVLGRAKGPVRNPAVYVRAAMPEFVANEECEIYQWLTGRLAEHINANHPTIADMQCFVKQAAENHDLPLRDT
jgi:hypothetical protein